MILLSLLFRTAVASVAVASAPACPVPTSVDADSVEPIPGILKLKEGATLPPSIYEQNTPTKIAVSLVCRMYRDYEARAAAKVHHPSYDYLNDTELQLVFPDAALDGILENGFLNQHQHPSSGGLLKPELRADLEDRMLGIHLEARYGAVGASAHDVRPKYALLGFQQGDPDRHPFLDPHVAAPDSGTLFSASQFGNVVAVFRADVKARTTFSMDDSLDRLDRKYRKFTKAREVRTLGFRAEDNLAAETGAYIEAQVWGPLSLADVDHFLVRCAPFRELNEEGLRKLKKTRKPVYQCVETKRPYPNAEEHELPATVRWSAGELL